MKTTVKKLLACLLLVCLLTGLMPVGMVAYAEDRGTVSVASGTFTDVRVANALGNYYILASTPTVDIPVGVYDDVTANRDGFDTQSLPNITVTKDVPVVINIDDTKWVTSVSFNVATVDAIVAVTSSGGPVSPESGYTYKLSPGAYDYTVSKVGFVNKGGSFTVNADGSNTLPAEPITLQAAVPSEVTFTITSDDPDVTTITNLYFQVTNGEGASVHSGTGASTTCNLPMGSYNYTVRGDGHFEKTGTLTIDGSGDDVPMNVELESHKICDVTFAVSDSADTAATPTLLSGATVEVNGVTVTEDDNMTVSLPMGTYSYTAIADAHLLKTGDTVVVSGHDAAYTKEVRLDAREYTFTFSCTPIDVSSDKVSVKIWKTDDPGKTPLDHKTGVSNVFQLPVGEYTYVYEIEGYRDCIAEQTLSVTAASPSDSITKSLDTSHPLAKVTFDVTAAGDSSISLADAVVTVTGTADNSFVQATNDPHVFYLDYGTGSTVYDFSVSCADYNTKTGTVTANQGVGSTTVGVSLESDVMVFTWAQLKSAIENQSVGGTTERKLAKNLTADSAISARGTVGKTVNLDLNGHSITGSISDTLFTLALGTLNITNTADSSTPPKISNTGAVFSVIPTGTLSLDGSTKPFEVDGACSVTGGSITVGTGVGLSVTETALTVSGGTANVSGTISNSSSTKAAIKLTTGTLNVNSGASVTSPFLALDNTGGTANISGGDVGSISQTGGTTNISGGAVGHIGQDGGTVAVTGGTVIGIATAGGTLNISGGTVGNDITGKAVEIVSTTVTTAVNISGGTLNGSTYSIYQSADPAPTNTTISISAGTFNKPVYTMHNLVSYTGTAAWTGNPNKDLSLIVSDFSGFVIKNTPNSFIQTDSNSPYTFTLTAAALAAAKTGGTLSFTCDAGTVSFDSTALNSLGTGAFSLTLTTTPGTSDPSMTISLDLTVGGAAVGSFGGGSATVTLPLSSEPNIIAHKKNGAAIEYFYKPDTKPASSTLPAKEFSWADGKATLVLAQFSDLDLYTATAIAPTITTTALPDGCVGDAYSVTLTADGTGIITWSATGLPTWLTLNAATGVLSGTPTAAGTVTPTFKATNEAGFDEQDLSVAVAEYTAKWTDSAGASHYYDSVADAVAAAESAATSTPADNTVTVLKNSTDAVTLTKSITFNGSGKTTGAITVTAGSPVIKNAGSSASRANINVSGGTPTLTAGNYVNQVSASGTGTTVYINGGDYNSLLGSGYQISGGSFGREITLGECLRDESVSPYIQYVPSAAKNSAGRYTVTKLVPDVTSVDPASAYFQMRSTKTMAFNTNIPYDLTQSPYATTAAPNGDIVRLTVTGVTGTSTRTLATSAYTVSKGTGNTAKVTLTNAYLRTLGSGNYILNIETNEGTASHGFSVGTAARTGDSSNIGMWMWIAGGSVLVLCAAAAFIIIRGKKRK